MLYLSTNIVQMSFKWSTDVIVLDYTLLIIILVILCEKNYQNYGKNYNL